MGKKDFFDEPKEQSIIKTRIVSEYFWAWAKIMLSNIKRFGGDRIAYVDLFSGPGRYDDGTLSTPLIILEQAIGDPEICARLVTIFNDNDAQHSKALEQAIEGLPGIQSLKHYPSIHNQVVGTRIVDLFKAIESVPMFFFVDPWGYKGLSLDLINSLTKDWGCDCVFFFNYNRINMGLENSLVREHMDALFGTERANELRLRLSPMTPSERELTIVEEIAQALKSTGGRFVLPFRFRNEAGNRTKHHLIFVSKNFKGYEVMKEVMAKFSTSKQQGVPTFEYSPASDRQPLLFEYARPLDDLCEMLLCEFAGKQLTMNDIYEKHSVGRPYLRSHYKRILCRLEQEGRITADPNAAKRRKGTFADHVLVTFPSRR